MFYIVLIFLILDIQIPPDLPTFMVHVYAPRCSNVHCVLAGTRGRRAVEEEDRLGQRKAPLLPFQQCVCVCLCFS